MIVIKAFEGISLRFRFFVQKKNSFILELTDFES